MEERERERAGGSGGRQRGRWPRREVGGGSAMRRRRWRRLGWAMEEREREPLSMEERERERERERGSPKIYLLMGERKPRRENFPPFNWVAQDFFGATGLPR